MGDSMGRKVGVETSERGPREATGAPGALDVLLEQALRGDEQALHILIELLQTEHYQRFIASLKRLATSAHTQTIEDVVQDSLIGLIEKIRAGELGDLSPEDRADFLGYFQRILDGALRNAVRARKTPVLDRNKSEVPVETVDPKVSIPGEPRHTEHRALLGDAIKNLSPEDALLLQMLLDGVSVTEIARRTGQKEGTLSKELTRIKNGLLLDILPRSATATLHYEKKERLARKWPSQADIKAVLSAFPPEIKEAVTFVHLEHRLSIVPWRISPARWGIAGTRRRMPGSSKDIAACRAD
jgi:RNA polymerase sigma factor (sigma-70 family)